MPAGLRRAAFPDRDRELQLYGSAAQFRLTPRPPPDPTVLRPTALRIGADLVEDGKDAGS